VIKIKSAFLPVLLTALALGAFAVVKLEINIPKDRSTTWSTRADIEGAAYNARKLDLNGVNVDLEEGGKFSAAALLKPGKNVIMATASYPNGQKISKKFRVLRMVTCDDIERSVGGKHHWARKQIVTLLTLGVIEGYPDNNFIPGKPLERSEFATWLARAKQLKVSAPEKDVFYDVPKEHWRAPYIKAVVDAGYMSAVSADRFGINDMITRGDAVAAVAKANGLAPLKLAQSPFLDVPSNSKNAPYIYSAHARGWIIGVPGKAKKYEPDRNMTRAEIAVLLSRLSTVKGSGALLYDFENGYTYGRYCRVGTKPLIRNAQAQPSKIIADGVAPLKISAKVTDTQGASDISQVWADLTDLGGPNNAEMPLIGDDSYELNFVMTSETRSGEKKVSVRALDKSGLKSVISVIKVYVTGKTK